MDTVETIRAYYNQSVQVEWERIDNRPEFLLTCRYLDRFLKPGDRVLDIGGGPGRYAFYLTDRGCDVTLLDLSEANVAFVTAQAKERNVSLKAMQGDARHADTVVSGTFDHVLLMGPLYHLLEEHDRIQAVNTALTLLKPGGTIFISFINLYAGMIYAMKFEPAIILDQGEAEFYQTVLKDESYAGPAFTQAFFINQKEVLPFMSRFPLEKLHFFGQEGITAPCEAAILSQPPDIVAAWLDLAEKLCEREELLSWSEHLMYVGRKRLSD